MDVYSPKTIKEAADLLAELRGDTRILAGGTDLVVRMKEKTVLPKNIINIKRLPLDYIIEDKEQIRICSLTSLATVSSSKIIKTYAPVLSDAAQKIGSPQIRNLGTIGGNIANASPAADTAPPLFVLNARIALKSQRGNRVIPIDKFFTAPGMTIMNRNEILTEIVLKKMENNEIWFFSKIGQRKTLALSKVSLAFRGKLNRKGLSDVSIALGAVAPTVIYAEETANFLNSKSLTDEVIDQAAEIIQLEAKPISDIRSTSEYRRKMVGALLKQGLLELRL